MDVVADESEPIPEGVEFFDDTGRRLGAARGSAFLARGPADVPIVQSAPKSVVYGSGGQKLADISRFSPGDIAILVGSRLLIERVSMGLTTEQYDLQTGARGKDCKVYLGGYLGTDGKVGVFESGNPNVGLVTAGMDLVTCDVLWHTESPIGSFRDVWRINTTLVQLSDDGTELTSLIAPR